MDDGKTKEREVERKVGLPCPAHFSSLVSSELFVVFLVAISRNVCRMSYVVCRMSDVQALAGFAGRRDSRFVSKIKRSARGGWMWVLCGLLLLGGRKVVLGKMKRVE